MNFLVKLAEFSWQKVMLIALAVTAGYYFLMFDDGTSLDASITAIKSSVESEKDLLKKTAEAMNDLQRFKEDLNSQEAQVKEVLAFLPRQMNASELLSTIQDRANQAGLRILKTDPQDEVRKVEFYEVMTINLELGGTFPQIVTFLSLISKLPRLVTLEKMDLAATDNRGSDSTRIEFKATLLGYRFSEEALDRWAKDNTNQQAQSANPPQ